MGKTDLLVKNSAWVELSLFNEGSRGLLAVGEEGKNIPFAIKRFYFITNFEKAEPDLERGGHAHKKTDQAIFCLKGSFCLKLDDGRAKQQFVLDQSSSGVRLGPSLWHSMSQFSKDCVILIIADHGYDQDDYLRNYDDFLEFIKQHD